MTENINNATEMAWNLSIDEAYQQLGLAEAGNENLEGAIRSMATVRGYALHSYGDVSVRSMSEWFYSKGLEYFKKIWNSIKKIACEIYRKDVEVKDGKDLVKYIAEKVIEAGTALGIAAIGNAVVILVITIAVKQGLDALCPAK